MTDKIFQEAASVADFSAINQQYAPFSVRPQSPDDDEWAENLHSRVFGPGRFARTAFRVREILPADPELCLIAQFEDKRVGSVWMTPISLGSQNGCLLGPLAIDPDFRSKGLGKMLVKIATNMALSREMYEFVVLVGDEEYYGDMGFLRAKAGTIIFPGPVDPNRILVCSQRADHAKNLSGNIL
ncbi:MAG: N-acetyltransferase [Devosiaceae bacterium]|nr:N-acetyltransferase [Devosiaceae bacterium]